MEWREYRGMCHIIFKNCIINFWNDFCFTFIFLIICQIQFQRICPLIDTKNILQKVINKDQFAAFANSFRGEGARKIYGAAAQQNVAKMVKGQANFAIGILVQTGWDVIGVTREKISGKQLAKNFFSNLGGAGGGIAGAVYGTCIGGPVGGIIGGIIGGLVSSIAIKKIADQITPDGGIIGGIIGGLVSSIAIKKIADQITPDDLDEMAEILQNQISILQQEEYLLSQQEFENVLEQIQQELKKDNDFLQKMFESPNKQKYAKEKIKPNFQKALSNRQRIQAIKEMNEYLNIER
ncbi:hypothetical protein ABPG72_014075 [Tetrahymena utriculariae]